jgi:hypothetical protein
MTRILGLALLLYILWMAVGNFMQKLKAATSTGTLRPPESPIPRSAVVETLVPCGACGTYVPTSRAIQEENEVFCSEGCRGQRDGRG